MNKLQTFQEFLANESVHIATGSFVINLVLAAVLTYLLGILYVRCSTTMSDKKQFSMNFLIISMVTMLIITIVKSSLALSLGLVGALSIVRFRTAIKEPEELNYLFFSIAIGLGLGAGQRMIVVIAFLVISTIIFLRHLKKQKEFFDGQILYLTITTKSPKTITLEQIISILKKHCAKVHIKRFDEMPDIMESSFLIDFSDSVKLQKIKEELQLLDQNMKINFVDNRMNF